MSNYKFLFDTETDQYLAITEGMIENRPLADCYDSNGQEVGSYIAGDTLALLTQEAVDFANNLIEEDGEEPRFDLEKNYGIMAYEDASLFDKVKEKFEGTEHIELYQEEVECITYWDGHNFKTEYLSGEGYQRYTLETDEEKEKELNELIENMEYRSESAGRKIFKSGNAKIEQSAWAGDFEVYSIELDYYDEEVEA